MKGIRVLLTSLSLIALTFTVKSQSIEEDISRLFEVSGSEQLYEESLIQMLDYFKTSYGDEAFFEEFEKEVLSTGIAELEARLTPLYMEVYTHEEIKALIELYESDLGIMLISKHGEISTRSFEIGAAWGEEMAQTVISRMNNIDESEVAVGNNDGVERRIFGRIELLENEHGKLRIDEEHNPGGLVLDFGDVTDHRTSSLGLKVKNISLDTVALQESFFAREEVEIDFGEGALLPGEEREILVMWDTRCLVGRKYQGMSFDTDKGDMVSFGIQGESGGKEVAYDIAGQNQAFKGFSGDYSKKHEFTITNTGAIDLSIKSLNSNNPAVLLSLEQAELPVGEEVKIVVVLSKDLMQTYDDEKAEAVIAVAFGKCSSEYWQEVVELKIRE